MNDDLIETVLAIVQREVGPVSIYARIEIERACQAIFDAASEVQWDWQPPDEGDPAA
ncbi:MAG TPA: hypothetical protein VEU08_18845 [Vicinamibacterales bacterium]|nr:hypothetical protein [Vicinamibacterales bacterium]